MSYLGHTQSQFRTSTKMNAVMIKHHIRQNTITFYEIYNLPNK